MFWALKTLRSYIYRAQFAVRTDHDALECMLNMSDPHGRIARWRLILSNFDFTVTYRPGFNNQVPEALSRCTPEYFDDAKVDNGISTFLAHVLVLPGAQLGARENKQEGETPEEDVHPYDVWDELSYQYRVVNL